MPDDPEATDPTPEADPIPEAQEDRIVDKVVNRLRDTIDTLTGKGGDPDPDPEPVTDPKTAEPTTAKGIEDDMESQVRKALEKVTADDKHKADHEKLAKETERTPETLGRVARALWGE